MLYWKSVQPLYTLCNIITLNVVSLNGGWQLQQSESQYNYALPLNFHAIYCQFFIITNYTDWLQLKYSTGQNAISRQRCEIFISKFLGLYGRDPATILNLKKNIILVFSKVMAV